MSTDITVTDKEAKFLSAFRKFVNTNAAEKGKNLAKELRTIFIERFVCKPPFQSSGNIHLNEDLLLQATISYYVDLYRVMGFHNIDEADNHKQAAYLFKWLTKLRPIKAVIDNAPELKYSETYANSFFAYLCAKMYLDIGSLATHEMQYVLYSASHRDIHPEEWAAIFYFMEVCKGVSRGQRTLSDPH